MANPVTYTIPADTWAKVATATTMCMVHTMTNNSFSHTYRLTGETGPENDDVTEAVRIRDGFLQFSSNASSDVYIYSHVANGKVRVDQ